MKLSKKVVALAVVVVLGLSLIPAYVFHSVSPTQAAIGWAKYPGELTLDNERYVVDSWVIRDDTAPASERYKMWYTHGKTDLTPTDIINVLKTLNLNNIITDILNRDLDALLNDLIDLNPDLGDIVGLLDGSSTVIGYATSADGKTWTVQKSQALDDSSTGFWNSVGAPSVIWCEGSQLYKMWYTRVQTDLTQASLQSLLTGLGGNTAARKAAILDLLSGTNTVIGYATSANGADWTVVDSNVLAGNGNASNSVGAPCVIWDDTTNEFKMWFTQGNTDLRDSDLDSLLTKISTPGGFGIDDAFGLVDGSSTVIGYATSPNGIDWTVQVPAVLTGSGGAWDSIGDPSVIKSGGTYQMWYTRTQTNLTQAKLLTIANEIKALDPLALFNTLKIEGLAAFITDLTALDISTLKSLLVGNSVVIGYASSADGINWTPQTAPDLVGGGSPWSSVAAPTVVKTGSQYEMWYTEGIGDLTWQNVVDVILGQDLPIGYAYYIPYVPLPTKVAPTATTNAATDIATDSATLNGSLDDMGSFTSVDVSFEYGTTSGDLVNATTPEELTATGSFSAGLTDLSPDTTYYFRAKAEGDGKVGYGAELSFTTLPVAPTVTTNAATSITANSATLNGSLDDMGSFTSVDVSFEYGTTSGDLVNATTPEELTATGSFSAGLTDLSPDTTYYFRAKAEGDGKVGYGAELSFTTLSVPPVVPPTVEEIEEMTPEEAADVIEEVAEEDPEAAADIIEEVETEAAADIIEEVETEAAADIIEEVATEAAADIIEEVETEAAADIIEEVATEAAADIIEEVETEAAADILEEVETDKAVDIMEEVATDTLNDLVGEMSEESLTETLPEVSVDTLHSVDVDTLFEALPNAPTEQLTSEEPPEPPEELTAPIVRYVTPEGAQYVAVRTEAGEWVVVMGTPMPVDKLMIKTNKALTNVETTLVVSDELPAEVTVGLSAEQIVLKYLDISFVNATPEDIDLGHMTFKVEKEWLEENSIHKWSVALSYYDPELEQWVTLPTKRVAEDDTYVYYTVSITHYSKYAISGSQTLPPRSFEVANLAIDPAEAELGEDVAISGDVANLSGTAGTFAVTLWLDNTVEAGKNVSLEAGETKAVSFTVTRDTEGTYEVRFDRLFGSFSVTKAPPPEVPAPPPPKPFNWWLVIGPVIGVVVIIGIVVGVILWRRRI